MHDYAGAIVDYTMALTFNVKVAKVYVDRGTAKAKLYDYKGAISDYNKAIQHDHTLEQAFWLRRGSKTRDGDIYGGLQDIDTAIMLNPKATLTPTAVVAILKMNCPILTQGLKRFYHINSAK